ncbi:hypothetical protein SEUCBS139899_009852 [Sporothrix eucalyptigena]
MLSALFPHLLPYYALDSVTGAPGFSVTVTSPVPLAGLHDLGQLAVLSAEFVHDDTAASAQTAHAGLGLLGRQQRWQQVDGIAVVALDEYLGDGGGKTKVAVDLKGRVAREQAVEVERAEHLLDAGLGGGGVTQTGVLA